MVLKQFDYRREADRLLTHRAVSLIGVFHKHMGMKKTLGLLAPHCLDKMARSAIIQLANTNTLSYGFHVTFQRIKELTIDKQPPKNEMEASISRYTRALSIISDGKFTHENLMSDIIALNNVLVYDTLDSTKCQWRIHDKPLSHFVSVDESTVSLPPADMVEPLVAAMCKNYSTVIKSGEVDPLLIIPVFVMDLQVIQPFDRGLFEMPRLITYYLMQWAGYGIGDSINLDQYITRNKLGAYHHYPQIQKGWETGENDYQQLLYDWTNGMRESCNLFEEWVEFFSTSYTTTDLVAKVMSLHKGSMSKREIMGYIPDVGEASVEVALNNLKKKGLISMSSSGRYAEYTYIGTEVKISEQPK